MVIVIWAIFSQPYYAGFQRVLENDPDGTADLFFLVDFIMEACAFLITVILPFRLSRIFIAMGVEVVTKSKIVTVVFRDVFWWMNVLGHLLGMLVWARTSGTKFFGLCRFLCYPYATRWLSLYLMLNPQPESQGRQARREVRTTVFWFAYVVHILTCVW